MAERIDNLHIAPYKIIQDKETFCFGIDAVLLSWWGLEQLYALPLYNEKSVPQVLDLGTGNGIIPILMTANEIRRKKNLSVTGIEIQARMADMARRSVKLNGLQNSIEIVEGDIKQIASGQQPFQQKRDFDLVVSNPPYMVVSQGRQSQNRAKMIARQELCCNLEDVVKAAWNLVKDDGVFCMIHRWVRLDEIISCLKNAGFADINYRGVVPFEGDDPVMVLVSCRKNNQGSKKEEALEKLTVYSSPGIYTDEVKKIYKRDYY